MEEDLDPFDYLLAEGLGMTVQDIWDKMPMDEYLRWRAFYVYRNAQQELASSR